MPESFESLLSDIAQSASASTRPVGAESARRRGRQRTVRQRTAASVLAVVLVGGTGGIAAAVASHHSAPPTPITNSRTPTPTPSVSNTPASPSTSPSPSSSPSPSAGTPGVIGDVSTIVPGAWTPASQFAINPGGWTANITEPAIHTTDRQWFYSCRGADTFGHLGANGYQEMSYKPTSSGTLPAADQVLFFFPSTAAAQQALGAIRDDYAHCPEQSIGLNNLPMTGTVRQTEQLDGGYAWLHTFRTAQGGLGEPTNIPSDNHEFFVQRGDVVEMVWFGGDAGVDQQNNDLTFLAALESNLCVYGGSCPATPHPLTATITANGSTTLHLGGSAIEFTVEVANNSDETMRNVAPIVSLGHCTCSNALVPMMPMGVFQLWDASAGVWKTLFYDAEGSGMDYLLGPGDLQVPAFDLGAGRSLSFKYRLQLDPASANHLSGPYHLSDGTASVDVTLVHPVQGGGNEQIGATPTGTLPVNVLLN